MSDQEKIVYLIEPDVAVRDSIKTLLESFNIQIRTYASGRSFLNNAKPNGNGYVLIESNLPDMTGMELNERLKGQGVKSPVILITSANDPGFDAQHIQNVDAILRKPLHSEKIVELIETL